MEDYPAIAGDAPAIEAVRMIGRERRPAIVVLDGDRPLTALPSSQVLNFIIPRYLQDDPSLVGVYGDEPWDACVRRLAGKTVRELLPQQRRVEIPMVDLDATTMTCAATMAKLRSPLLIVVDHDGSLGGVITASRLVDRLLGER